MKNLAMSALAEATRGSLSLVLALLVLTGCGQKGPLQLPGYGKDTPWPVPPKARPADSDAAKGAASAGAGNVDSGGGAGSAAAPDGPIEESGVTPKDAAKAAGAGTTPQGGSSSPDDAQGPR